VTARLDADFRLTLVSAPAGYGKTATLASWAATVEEPLAWLSCDRFDVEPTRFMSCLLATIDKTWPGVADDAFVLLEREGGTIHDAAVAVANELAAVDGRGVIVVDDLHLAEASPEALTAFISALPDPFRFVIGTRSDPPMSLARWRLQGDLVELRRDDLRFSDVEVAAFFGRQDLVLTADELSRLHALTEGWPAGVQLAAIALQRRDGHRDFLEAFDRTDRAVSDFLLTEVLADLSPATVEFLLATSVLDTFDAELCAAVTGAEDAGLVLERLLADNLFLVPLDDRSRWYRYHHLFGAFLRARLASLGSARLSAAHDVAGHALLARGDVAGALQHAVALGDAERAGQIVRDVVVNSMSLSDGADVTIQAIRLWLHHCGAEAVETDPTSLLELLIGLISLGATDDVPLWLARTRQAHPDADGPLLALIEAAWGEYRQHRGEPLEALRHEAVALDAVDGQPPAEGLLPLLHTVVARAHIQAGDLTRAAAVIDHALAHPVGHPVPDEVRHPALGAFLAARAGDLSSATDLADRAVRAADALGLGPHESGRIIAGLARVEVLVERNEDDDAAAALDHVKRASDGSHRSTLQAMVALQQARVARSSGDEHEAAVLLEHARVLYDAPDSALRHVLAEEAALQKLRFDPGGAGPLLDALDPARPATRALRARLALLEGEHRAAAELLAELPAPATRREAVEQSVMAALNALEREADRADLYLREALALSQPERLIRTIVDLGPGIHQLLKAYRPDPSEEAYVEELLAAAGREVGPARTRVVTTLVEPLSDREITVLRYLCSRLTYQEIAAALYVSLNTLKSHVRNVYRKLGVASRAEAVDAGRRHALI
jgi:LuxR family maltose regulon positive regulatory protein